MSCVCQTLLSYVPLEFYQNFFFFFLTDSPHLKKKKSVNDYNFLQLYEKVLYVGWVVEEGVREIEREEEYRFGE